MRILPRLNEDVNEEWLSDKARFSYDGLKRQRLDQPMVKNAAGTFDAVTWLEAMQAIEQGVKGLKGSEMAAVAGELADAEALISLKDLMNKLGSNKLLSTQDDKLSADLRSEYIFNPSITGIEESDVVLLVGTNPRMEAPLVATRIRKAQTLNPRHRVALVGPKCDLAFPYSFLGPSSQGLQDLVAGTGTFSKTMKNAKRPMVIVGMAAVQGKEGESLLKALQQLSLTYPSLKQPDWNGVAFLHSDASRVAQLDLGWLPGPNTGANPYPGTKFFYLLNADDEELNKKIPADAFVVYHGHHGDIGVHRANVILPATAYTEKDGTYVNTEGRVQLTRAASGRLNEAREDWAIIRALSEILEVRLPYETLKEVRLRLRDVAPHFGHVDTVEPMSFHDGGVVASSAPDLSNMMFQPLIKNHWMTNPISRSSRTMAKCSSTLPTATNSYIS